MNISMGVTPEEFEQFKADVQRIAEDAFAGVEIPQVLFCYRQASSGQSMHVMGTNMPNTQALALAAAAVAAKLADKANEELAKANPQ